MIQYDLQSERISGLLCPEYKLGARMETERSVGKLNNNPGALKEGVSVKRDSRGRAGCVGKVMNRG